MYLIHLIDVTNNYTDSPCDEGNKYFFQGYVSIGSYTNFVIIQSCLYNKQLFHQLAIHGELGHVDKISLVLL